MGFRDVRRRQCPPELADDLTNNTLADKELLAQYKRIEQLSNEDKYLISLSTLSCSLRRFRKIWYSDSVKKPPKWKA